MRRIASSSPVRQGIFPETDVRLLPRRISTGHQVVQLLPPRRANMMMAQQAGSPIKHARVPPSPQMQQRPVQVSQVPPSPQMQQRPVQVSQVPPSPPMQNRPVDQTAPPSPSMQHRPLNQVPQILPPSPHVPPPVQVPASGSTTPAKAVQVSEAPVSHQMATKLQAFKEQMTLQMTQQISSSVASLQGQLEAEMQEPPMGSSVKFSSRGQLGVSAMAASRSMRSLAHARETSSPSRPSRHCGRESFDYTPCWSPDGSPPGSCKIRGKQLADSLSTETMRLLAASYKGRCGDDSGPSVSDGPPLDTEKEDLRRQVLSLQERNSSLETTVQSLVSRMNNMEAQLSGKNSVPYGGGHSGEPVHATPVGYPSGSGGSHQHSAAAAGNRGIRRRARPSGSGHDRPGHDRPATHR